MQELQDKMKKTIDSLIHNFGTVRTGRANPEILSNVKVEAYGSQMPINQVATVHVQDSNVLVITPFDKGTIREIERGIEKSDIGLMPSNDGINIRLTIPALTEERRKELEKQVKKMAEESKVATRNIRRDFMDKVKKDDELSEDEKVRKEQDIQKETDKHIEKVDQLLKEKEKEIMEI